MGGEPDQKRQPLEEAYPGGSDSCEHIDYLRELVVRLTEVASQLDRTPALVELDDRSAAGAEKDGKSASPPLRPDLVGLDEELARRALDTAVDVTLEHSGRVSGLRLLQGLIRRGDIRAGKVIAGAAMGDRLLFEELGSRFDLDPRAVHFVAMVAASAIWHRLAGRLESPGSDTIESRDCPTCGSRPWLSRLREGEGRRSLECCLCGTSWPAYRLRCPFCGNEEPQTLTFLAIEGEPYRVDLCDRCLGYIKTHDVRQARAGGASLPWLIEDAQTLHLDVLAFDAGYHSPRAIFVDIPVRGGRVRRA